MGGENTGGTPVPRSEERMVEIKQNPTKKDLVVFALLWGGFFALLGRVAWTRPEGLGIAAIVTGGALVVSLAFNREHAKRVQMYGAVIPLALGALWAMGSGRVPGVEGRMLFWGMAGVGVAGAAATLASAGAGKRLYTAWMCAAVAMGWTFARIILGLVLFLVLTPIGLALRATGRDPLERKLERGAKTYWKEYRQPVNPGRYYRQF